ncbi:MAG: hypothetical protein AAFN77_19330 [Planctomycetota bacterium]
MKRLFVLLAFCCLVGCVGETKVVEDTNGPLSLEDWKVMDVSSKYELETFDRLKLAMPKLKNDKVWEKFMRKVVVPARRIDIPTEY